MPQAVCFDLDGTLFDDRQYVRGGLEHAGAVLADRTGVDLTEAFLDAYFERGIRGSAFDTVLTEHNISLTHVPALVEAYHNNNATIRPFPDARQTLRTLAEDYDLGVVSGGRNGYDKLRRLDLIELFDVIVITPRLNTSKQEPEPFTAALAGLDVSISAGVYVGDRPAVDFEQPNQLGMYTVRVLRGQYADCKAMGDTVPDITVNTLAEIPSLLAEKNVVDP